MIEPTKVNLQVDRYNPMSIVVGTRSQSMAESSFGKKSISEYLYQHSPVPVVIVRRSKIREKKLRKRKKLVERGKYKRLLKQSNERSDTQEAPIAVPVATRQESEEVRKAIGFSHDDPEKVLAFIEKNQRQMPTDDSGPFFPDTSEDDSDEHEDIDALVAKKDRESLTDDEEADTESDDNEESASLSRTSSAGSNLRPGWANAEEIKSRPGNVSEPWRDFKQMPNYIEGVEQDGKFDAEGSRPYSRRSFVGSRSTLDLTVTPLDKDKLKRG